MMFHDLPKPAADEWKMSASTGMNDDAGVSFLTLLAADVTCIQVISVMLLIDLFMLFSIYFVVLGDGTVVTCHC